MRMGFNLLTGFKLIDYDNVFLSVVISHLTTDLFPPALAVITTGSTSVDFTTGSTSADFTTDSTSADFTTAFTTGSTSANFTTVTDVTTTPSATELDGSILDFFGDDISDGARIAIIVGAVVFLLIVCAVINCVILAYCCSRYRKRKRESHSHYEAVNREVVTDDSYVRFGEYKAVIVGF